MKTYDLIPTSGFQSLDAECKAFLDPHLKLFFGVGGEKSFVAQTLFSSKGDKRGSRCLFLFPIRDEDANRGAPIFAWGDRQRSLDGGKALADIAEGNVWLAVIVFRDSGAIVRYDDPTAFLGFLGFDPNAQRLRLVEVHPIFDGVLHKRLQGEGRKAEQRVRRVELDQEFIFKLRLNDREVGAGVL